MNYTLATGGARLAVVSANNTGRKTKTGASHFAMTAEERVIDGDGSGMSVLAVACQMQTAQSLSPPLL